MSDSQARERSIGQMAVFLVPSLKIKRRLKDGKTVEEEIHNFLLDTFGGYTASAGNIFGYWKDGKGQESYGEHKEYKVGLVDDRRADDLKRYIGRLAKDLDEECIYFEYGKEALFIYGE
jgi:hypothetical protein